LLPVEQDYVNGDGLENIAKLVFVVRRTWKRLSRVLRPPDLLFVMTGKGLCSIIQCCPAW